MCSARVVLMAVLVVGVMMAQSASAGSVLVSSSTGDFGHGYGFDGWDDFTAALDSATGNQVDVTSDFTNLSQMLSYSAVMLDQRWTDGALLPGEAANISAFIATGRRVLFMGENDIWSAWNSEILGIVGGSFVSEFDGPSNSILSHQLTAGVTTVSLHAAGLATGGTPLFDQNFATLWGSQNVLTILDVNVFDDDYASEYNNTQFVLNVAHWLAVPELSSGALALVGALAALVGLRMRRGIPSSAAA